MAHAGAVTWGNAATGITDVISIANSLVGSTANDWVGYGFMGGMEKSIIALSDGNYMVHSTEWTNPRQP